MIYVSTGAVREKTIAAAVLKLVNYGFKEIELTGGTDLYDGYENDLLNLQAEYGLNYLCHNYFPPPKEHFVLNLASTDNTISKRTSEHLKKAIELSAMLGGKKFGYHAGFLIDINVKEIGKKLSKSSSADLETGIRLFTERAQAIQEFGEHHGVKVYIENNVYSYSNYQVYGQDNPLMLCDVKDYEILKESMEINLLLDVGHLKVSAKTLGNDFAAEFKYLASVSEYLHISDNDGLHDQNLAPTEASELSKLLSQVNLKDKTITLEIYQGLPSVLQAYNMLSDLQMTGQ